MTEYGPELKLFVLKSSMSWHCFVLKASMSWHCFEIKRTDMHVSEFLNAKCLVQVTHRDVCGRFVVAVSFAEGNVRANGACDRVVRVVQSRGNSVAGAA